MDSISSEIRARIMAAANELWTQAGEGDRFPTVDAVRKAARVSMNDASTVMREWRRMQTTQAAKVTLEIPDRVHEAVRLAGSEIWQAAQDIASEQLAAAQQQWEQERLEAETMRKELADAYDAAQAESENLRAQIEQMKVAAEQLAAEHIEEVRRLEDGRHKMESRAGRAEQDAQHQRAAAERLAVEQKELREKLDAASEKWARAEQRVTDLHTQIERFQAAAEQLAAKHGEEIRRLEDARRKMESRAERAEQDAQHRRTAAEHLAVEQKELREKLDAETEKGTRADQQVMDLKEELTRERARIETLISRLEGPERGPQTQ